VVQVEAIDRAPIDDSGIVKTRKCRNRSRPLSDWVVQQRLAAELCKLVRHLLRRRCNFEDDTYFVGEVLRVGLKTAHHCVDTVGMKVKTVRTLICLVTQHLRYALVDIAAHGGQPAVQLTDDVRITYAADNNALISRERRSLKLHRVRLGYEFAPSDSDRHVVDRFKGRLRQVEGPGAFTM